MRYCIARIQVTKENVPWIAVTRRFDGSQTVDIFMSAGVNLQKHIPSLFKYEELWELDMTGATEGCPVKKVMNTLADSPEEGGDNDAN